MSNESRYETQVASQSERLSNVGLTVALVTLAAVGVGLAIQQIKERRLSKPEIARLKFYRYLHEKGHLES